MKNIQETIDKLSEVGYYKYESTPKETIAQLARSEGSLFVGMDWQKGRMFRVHRDSFGIEKLLEWKDRILSIAKAEIKDAIITDKNEIFEVKINDETAVLPKEFYTDFYSLLTQILGTANAALRSQGSRCEFYSIFTGEKEAFAILLTREMAEIIYDGRNLFDKMELPERAEKVTDWA